MLAYDSFSFLILAEGKTKGYSVGILQNSKKILNCQVVIIGTYWFDYTSQGGVFIRKKLKKQKREV